MKFTKQGLENTKIWKIICGELTPSDEIKHIYENNSLRECEIKFLCFSVKYDLPNISERFEIYRNIPPKQRKANSLYNYELKYGKDVGSKLYREKNKACKHTLENFVNRYGDVEGLKRYKEHNSKKRETLDNFIRRYGNDEGNKRYKAFCERNKGNMSLSRQQQLYGEEEGLNRHKKLRDFFKANSSLEGHILRFGKEMGHQKFFAKMTKMHSATKRNINGCSSSSQKLFRELFESLKYYYSEIFFSSLNKEYNVKQYFLDFYVKDVNKCIEYNGDSFHANPSIYGPDDCPHPYIKDVKSKDIWLYDNKRLEEIQDTGIVVLTVWEKDFKTNPTETIKRCIDFINEK